MQQLTRDNISRVQKILKKENKNIKSGGIISAITSIAAPSLVSAFTFPHDLLVTSLIGVSGVGLTVKFLIDKFKLEKTENDIGKMSKHLENDKELETKFNELIIDEKDSSALRKLQKIN
jgi:hypothetical protein